MRRGPTTRGSPRTKSRVVHRDELIPMLDGGLRATQHAGMARAAGGGRRCRARRSWRWTRCSRRRTAPASSSGSTIPCGGCSAWSRTRSGSTAWRRRRARRRRCWASTTRRYDETSRREPVTAADRWREQLAGWAHPRRDRVERTGVAVGVRDGVLPATRRGGSRSRADADDPPSPRSAPRGRHRARRRRRRRRDVAPAGRPGRVDRGDRSAGRHARGIPGQRRGGGRRGARGDRGMARGCPRTSSQPTSSSQDTSSTTSRSSNRSRARSTDTPAAASSSSSPSGIRSTGCATCGCGSTISNGPTDPRRTTLPPCSSDLGSPGWVVRNGWWPGGLGSGGFARREDAIHSVRKRLCLPADRDPEIAEALGGRLRERRGPLGRRSGGTDGRHACGGTVR